VGEHRRDLRKDPNATGEAKIAKPLKEVICEDIKGCQVLRLFGGKRRAVAGSAA